MTINLTRSSLRINDREWKGYFPISELIAVLGDTDAEASGWYIYRWQKHGITAYAMRTPDLAQRLVQMIVVNWVPMENELAPNPQTPSEFRELGPTAAFSGLLMCDGQKIDAHSDPLEVTQRLKSWLWYSKDTYAPGSGTFPCWNTSEENETETPFGIKKVAMNTLSLEKRDGASKPFTTAWISIRSQSSTLEVLQLSRHPITLLLPWTWLDVLTTKITVSTTTLSIRRGLFTREHQDFSIQQLSEGSTSEPLLGRLLGYGTLELPRSGKPIKIRYILDIQGFRTTLDAVRRHLHLRHVT